MPLPGLVNRLLRHASWADVHLGVLSSICLVVAAEHYRTERPLAVTPLRLGETPSGCERLQPLDPSPVGPLALLLVVDDAFGEADCVANLRLHRMHLLPALVDAVGLVCSQSLDGPSARLLEGEGHRAEALELHMLASLDGLNELGVQIAIISDLANLFAHCPAHFLPHCPPVDVGHLRDARFKCLPESFVGYTSRLAPLAPPQHQTVVPPIDGAKLVVSCNAGQSA